MKHGLWLLIGGALLTASAALGQTAQQQAEAKTNQLASEGRDYFRRAEAAEAEGNYTSACTNFRNSAALFQNANAANIGMLTEIGSGGQYDKDTVLANGRSLGNNSQLADARAKNVCGRTDAVRAAPSYASGESAGGGAVARSEPDFVRPDMSAQVAALQVTINKGYGFAQVAAARYSARDAAGSCQNANNAAAQYAQARSDARAILKASGGYGDIGVRDLRAIDANAEKSASEARDFYCQPIALAPDYAPEIRALMALKADMHLERATPTPLTRERVTAGRLACATPQVFAAGRANASLPIAIGNTCQAIYTMYAKAEPARACDNLFYANEALDSLEPGHAAQGKSLRAAIAAIGRGFKCNGKPADAVRPQGAGADLKVVEPNLPPPSLNTKPFPARPALPTG